MAEQNFELEAVKEIVRIKQEIVRGERIGTVKMPEDAAEVARNYIGDEDREVFLVMVLNTRNDVIAVHRAHVGSLSSSIVHPREVYKAAFINNGASIIVAHNHPGQSRQASKEDIDVTRRLVEAGKILGIELLDSLIVTADKYNYTSLKEKGYL